jgi:hypothetical protein
MIKAQENDLTEKDGQYECLNYTSNNDQQRSTASPTVLRLELSGTATKGSDPSATFSNLFPGPC